MKAAYNQNNLGFYPLYETYEDSCDNCIFIDQKTILVY